jgi:hypothetical protein
MLLLMSPGLTLHLTLKNFLSIVIGVCVVGLALIPLLVSPEQLGWPRWKIGICVIAFTTIVAICLQAVLQSTDEKEHSEIMHGLAEKLDKTIPNQSKVSPSLQESLELGLGSSGPRVYVQVLDKRRDMHPRTPFEITNQGTDVAHHIQIQPIKLTVGVAEFEEVDFLEVAAKREVLPEISKASVFQKYNVFSLFLKEWNAANDLGTREFVIRALATYTDHSGQSRFQVSFDIVYLPINDILYETWPESRDRKPLFEVRNTTFKRLEAAS